MKKKIKKILVAYIILGLLSISISWKLTLAMMLMLMLMGISCIIFLKLNDLYKKTNHWKNRRLFQKNFISNLGYRDNLTRNLDIVNLGSNPAMFGFFYENIKGQNWSTGSQGLSMDYEILKYFHSYIRQGGYILIPIMPFTAISQYLKTKTQYWSDEYYSKFAYILDYYQSLSLPNGKKILLMNKYPILFNPNLLKYLLHDSEVDTRLNISEQTMCDVELEQDAKMWMQNWMKEFDVKSYTEFWDSRFASYVAEAKTILKDIIDFCEYRDLNPVLITVPMSHYLAGNFTDDFKKNMIYDFINGLDTKVLFLDYMFDKKFSDSDLYNGSFFLNLRGRKLFTREVVNELKKYENTTK